MIHQAYNTGNRVLNACDYVGEKCASILGITTPKYSYEIEQFKKMQKEREKVKEEEKTNGGWMQATNNNNIKSLQNDNPVQCIITQENLQKF